MTMQTKPCGVLQTDEAGATTEGVRREIKFNATKCNTEASEEPQKTNKNYVFFVFFHFFYCHITNNIYICPEYGAM